MSLSNPIDITLNQTTPVSLEYDVRESFRGTKVQFLISGTFGGATVILESYISAFQGWQPLTFRTDSVTTQQLAYSTQANSDVIDLPFIGKIRVVCNGVTALTNLKASFIYQSI